MAQLTPMARRFADKLLRVGVDVGEANRIFHNDANGAPDSGADDARGVVPAPHVAGFPEIGRRLAELPQDLKGWVLEFSRVQLGAENAHAQGIVLRLQLSRHVDGMRDEHVLAAEKSFAVEGHIGDGVDAFK